MSWRTIVVTSKCKLTYKNDYLIIRSEQLKAIHLSEISTIIIDSTAVTLTSYLISALLDRKVKIVFCDAKRNPQGEILPYYGCHNASKRLNQQIGWSKDFSTLLWTVIIKEKILKQADVLKEIESDKYSLLYEYIDGLTIGDKTNREGHSAKVYFNALFGKDFTREQDNDINVMLNYGYSILLSQFNKEIVANGYSTQLGMKHHNEFNMFNLSSDIMEPFRVLIDKIVYENQDQTYSGEIKNKLIQVLNQKVVINNASYYVPNAISIYVRSIFEALNKEKLECIKFFDYEL